MNMFVSADETKFVENRCKKRRKREIVRGRKIVYHVIILIEMETPKWMCKFLISQLCFFAKLKPNQIKGSKKEKKRKNYHKKREKK